MIYVESSACEFSVVEKYIKDISCKSKTTNFKHKYSIPYVGDE